MQEAGYCIHASLNVTTRAVSKTMPISDKLVNVKSLNVECTKERKNNNVVRGSDVSLHEEMCFQPIASLSATGEG